MNQLYIALLKMYNKMFVPHAKGDLKIYLFYHDSLEGEERGKKCVLDWTAMREQDTRLHDNYMLNYTANLKN